MSVKMSIYGPGKFNHNIPRLNPVEEDNNDENSGDKRQKKVLYQGRSWSEKEEDLPVQPPVPAVAVKENKNMGKVYGDELLYERAHLLFDRLAVLEDKVAQLCVYDTAAWYDKQEYMEDLIQKWQLGGFLFYEGSDIRQDFLIERFKKFTKIPLFLGCHFEHALLLYGRNPKTAFPKVCNDREIIELGKSVMLDQRRHGMQFIYLPEDVDFKSLTDEFSFQIPKELLTFFKKGVRMAEGMIGKERGELLKKTYPLYNKKHELPSGAIIDVLTPLLDQTYQEEAISIRTLHFHALDDVSFSSEDIQAFFQSHDDLLMIRNNVHEVIEKICTEVREGRIQEGDLDRKVMRILLMKARI